MTGIFRDVREWHTVAYLCEPICKFSRPFDPSLAMFDLRVRNPGVARPHNVATQIGEVGWSRYLC
jgi:hypothetical protein